MSQLDLRVAVLANLGLHVRQLLRERVALLLLTPHLLPERCAVRLVRGEELLFDALYLLMRHAHLDLDLLDHFHLAVHLDCDDTLDLLLDLDEPLDLDLPHDLDLPFDLDHLLDLDDLLHLLLHLDHVLDDLIHHRAQLLLAGFVNVLLHRRAACVCQRRLEPRNFLLKLAKHRVLRVLVDLGLVLDVLGAVGIPQRRHRFVKIPIRRPEIGHHHGLRVPAKRVLQQARQPRVAVRDVRALAVDEGRDAVAERRERQVDLGRLLESVAARLRLRLALGARQVDEVELAHADGGRAVLARLARLDGDRVDRVRAGRVLVHGRCAHVPILGAEVTKLVALASRLDHVRREVTHVHTRVRVLLQLELVGRVLREQIADLLVVDLEVGGAHEELGILAATRRDEIEDLLEGTRDDASQLGRIVDALHREGLAGAGLAVGEDGAVEAIDDGFDDARCRIHVNVLLSHALVVHLIERERLWRLVAADWRHYAGAVLGIHMDDALAPIAPFLAVQRAAAHTHTHALLLLAAVHRIAHVVDRGDGLRSSSQFVHDHNRSSGTSGTSGARQRHDRVGPHR
ncbi:hypothetical protein Ctob_003354 [Chrysochromulina tobinii]|uniref:NAD-specific glutamate dehydrogenase n=1 Tax=Chrysochromulina tobinii TaxID=1460289 RepID=A0A0M0J7Z3_9EUKA|nr:hypothetical protein Ctob_003354 [Chrysochromulina tobinii]|eukprot:KOO22595.1 hypothetical protein Ctob_003354 [Chrysochromulina sp. CCMP291]